MKHLIKNVILTSLLFQFGNNIFAQQIFPDGHYCNTQEGKDCKVCQALSALKSMDHKQIIVVPHRGLWGTPGIPETSLRAVKEAYDAGYMFCEIDLVLTKDKKVVLSHDMQLNRTTDAPPTFSTDGGTKDPGNFFRSLNWETPTIGSVPDGNGDIYPTFPPLKELHYKDRYGNITKEKLNLFEEALEFCQDKDFILALDIKATNLLSDETIRHEYFEVIKKSLEMTKSRNMLHKIIIKPGSSGQVKVSELKGYLDSFGLWTDFSQHTNIILINIIGVSFPLATNKAYLDEWINIPSVIGVEHIYKDYKDGLILPNPDFGGISIVQYTKEKGKKTGVFHPIPTDVSGTPGGRGHYYNPKNFGDLDDLRGNMEFLFGVSENIFPGILVTDRPDVDMDFLSIFNLNSKYTKRNF